MTIQRTMETVTKRDLKKLYEIDDHLWLEETIKLLKANRLDELDLDNLIEELESLSRKDKAKVKSLLEQVIRHLLLLQYWTREYDLNANHWRAEIRSFRHQLEYLLTSNLPNHLNNELDNIYLKAVNYVRDKTGKEIKSLPQNSPYSLAQFLDPNWYPEIKQ
jgi:hypothetical protein